MQLLREPEAAAELSLADWDLVVRQARSAMLLPGIATTLSNTGLLATIPSEPRRHLEWSLAVAAKHARDVAWEVAHVRAALATTAARPILLKGSAYLMAGLPAGAGRIFADIDILVPVQLLPEVEKALVVHGWIVDPMSKYDQHYYRTWMHELPPMRHATRGAVLDVHHTIAPRTSRSRVEANRIIGAAQPIADGGLHVLSPEDMALHAIMHSFHDGDFAFGLRELVDIDSLLRDFSAQPDFWRKLVARAEEFGAARPLWYALRCATRLMRTPIPQEAAARLDRHAPNPLLRIAMDALLSRALQPNHRSCASLDAKSSRFLLYIRSHYLRMPLRLLLPHLARKAAMGLSSARKRPA